MESVNPLMNITAEQFERLLEALGSQSGSHDATLIFTGLLAFAGIIFVMWWVLNLKLAPLEKLSESLEKARDFYFEHTHREMEEIMAGRGKEGAFTPSEGLREFLYELKAMNVKIGLVTSGLYEKAWPEILSAFRTLDMGRPEYFYDCAITAGYPLRKGSTGTLGELSPKPHPWLYAEAATVGLGIPESERNHVVGIEDSGAGAASIRLAGFPAIGFGGGNINASGTRALCEAYCENFKEVLEAIKKMNEGKGL